MTVHAAAADRALVAAIAGGSITALERLYDCHGRWVFSLARRIVGSHVRRGQDALPPLSDSSAARVLQLAYFQGLSHAEIAQQTVAPIGTVGTHVRSAIETLRASGAYNLT